MGDWTYEAKDFLTPAPYEALYQFHGQPFVHETKLQELSVYAANQGFRGFKSMYKKYIESLKAQAGTVYVDNVTNFTGQPLELNAGDWDATDLGVYRRNGFADELACPHPIMPVERLINIDTGEEKLKLAFRKGTMWRRLIISKTILANANKVTELAGSGIAVTSQSARAFVQYISDLENLNYDTISERKCIGRLGYIQDEGFSPFVDGLIFDGDANFMELRPYQRECIETIEAQAPGAYLAQMATGLGKTVTFANIPRHGERMLILSHREELVEQPRKYFDCTYGIERASSRSHGEEVVSASVQSLVRRLDRFRPDDFRLIICDEAHHAAARTYRAIFDYFRPEKLIGFTATPNRGDKVRLDMRRS